MKTLSLINNIIKTASLVAALSVTTALRAAEKPEPTGIYDLVFGANGQPANLTNNPLLTNPNVDGFRYRASWKAIEPNEGQYNWRQIDAAISVASSYGKKLSISISAGLTTPDWVYTNSPVVYKYEMIETDPETGESIGNQPLPWDHAYQAKWLAFVAAFGARYDSNPACSYIPMGGFMQNFPMTLAKTAEDDAAMNALAQHPPSGYPGLTTSYMDSSAAFVPAAQTIITGYIQSFPTTPVILTLGHAFPTAAGTRDQTVVKNWGISNFPGRFGTMVSALYATPAPHKAPPITKSSPKGFQMVCRTSDVSRLYLAPAPHPLPLAPIPLQDALERGVTLSGKFVEIYQDDLISTQTQSILSAERTKLQNNAAY